MINDLSVTATSIFLSWNIPIGSLVNTSKVIWQRDSSLGCPDEDEGTAVIIDDSVADYTINNLIEDSLYYIWVMIWNDAGESTKSDNVSVRTLQSGEMSVLVIIIVHYR